MTEQLFRVSMEHKKTGEKIRLYVWASNVDEATHKLTNALFGAYGEYRWIGSGPEYGDDNKVIRRDVKD